MTSSYRPIDSKREEFRKYLEKSGAMDALTKVLVMLYDEPEKPADALDYIRKHLGDSRSDDAELDILKTDLEAAMLKSKTLEDEVKMLRDRLSQYEPEDKGGMEQDASQADTLGDTGPVPAATETPNESAPNSGENVPTSQ